MTQKMANAKMRDYEPMSDETGYVPVDAVFSAPAPALEGVSLGERLRLSRTHAGLTLDSASVSRRLLLRRAAGSWEGEDCVIQSADPGCADALFWLLGSAQSAQRGGSYSRIV